MNLQLYLVVVALIFCGLLTLLYSALTLVWCCRKVVEFWPYVVVLVAVCCFSYYLLITHGEKTEQFITSTSDLVRGWVANYTKTYYSHTEKEL